MSQTTCPKNRDLEAQRRAAAILAQSHPEPPRSQEPAMKRYVHPIPCWNGWPRVRSTARPWTGCWRS